MEILAQRRTPDVCEGVQVPPGQQSEAMQQILALAYIDGFLSPFRRMIVSG